MEGGAPSEPPHLLSLFWRLGRKVHASVKGQANPEAAEARDPTWREGWKGYGYVYPFIPIRPPGTLVIMTYIYIYIQLECSLRLYSYNLILVFYVQLILIIEEIHHLFFHNCVFKWNRFPHQGHEGISGSCIYTCHRWVECFCDPLKTRHVVLEEGMYQHHLRGANMTLRGG